jgi:hypothetical protein
MPYVTPSFITFPRVMNFRFVGILSMYHVIREMLIVGEGIFLSKFRILNIRNGVI